MKLLFDQNLSRYLVESLAAEFPDSIHVHKVGLDRASDQAVWDYAKVNGFAIVSKDSDFHQRSFLLGIHQRCFGSVKETAQPIK